MIVDTQLELLTNEQVAALLKRSPKTLRNWRLEGRGPRPTKVNGRFVGYRRSDVEAWLRQGQTETPAE